MSTYHLSLLELRLRTADLCTAVERCSALAREVDPDGASPDDPLALATVQECVAMLHAVAAVNPGLRQLLLGALALQTERPYPKEE